MKTLISAAVLSLALVAVQSWRGSIDSDAMFAALDIQPGQTVGEVGAGGGELTIAVARRVGDTGKVFSSELGANRVASLRRAVNNSGLSHITVVEGAPGATNFPDACCDAIFMRNVYHHFADPAAMNASIFRALEPGGRLAVIDFEPSRGRRAAGRPEDRDNDDSHGTTAETVARELAEAGFEVTRNEPGGNRWFMVVATKPR